MNIKIDYKNKLHSIGKQISNLEQIENAIKSRYPNQFKNGVIIALIEDGNVNEVKSFDEIIHFWRKNRSPLSIKIKVYEVPESSEKSQQVKQSILLRADPIYTQSIYDLSEAKDNRIPEQSDIFEVQQNVLKHQQNNTDVFIKHDKLEQSQNIYICWKCKGNKGDDNLFGFSRCFVCHGEGYFKPGNSFYEVVNQMVEDKVKSIFQKLNNEKEKKKEKEKVETIQKQSEYNSIQSMINDIDQRIQQFKPVQNKQIIKQLKQSKPDYKVGFTYPPKNIIECQSSSNFIWEVDFTNIGTIQWPSNISIYKVSNKIVQMIPVKSLSPGQSTKITIDMISPSFKCNQLKQFRLAYFDSFDNLIFFGPKFSFQLITKLQQNQSIIRQFFQKPQLKQQNDTEMIKKVIDAAKHVANQRHSIKLLVKKIKQFGLDASFPRDMLVDIIIQLQGQSLN